MADGKECATSGGALSGAASAAPCPPVRPVPLTPAAIVTSPISMATTGMAMGTPTLLTISNGAINIKAATVTPGNRAPKPEGTTLQGLNTLVRAAVPTLCGSFPRLPLLTPQAAGVNLRIPHPVGTALNLRVAPRGAVMLNTRALGPAGTQLLPAQVLPQGVLPQGVLTQGVLPQGVLTQGAKLVTAPHLGNGAQVTQALMAKVKSGQPLQIGMSLPVSVPAAVPGVPIASTVALTVPLQVPGVTTVPAQATLTSLPAATSLSVPFTAAPFSAASTPTVNSQPTEPMVTSDSAPTLPVLKLNNNNNMNKMMAGVTLPPAEQNGNGRVMPHTGGSIVAMPHNGGSAVLSVGPLPIMPTAPAKQPDISTSSLPSPAAGSPATAKATSPTPTAAGIEQGKMKTITGSTENNITRLTPSPPKMLDLVVPKPEVGELTKPSVDNKTEGIVKTVVPSVVIKEEGATTTVSTADDTAKEAETDNFDPMKVMDWSDGIGSLPGSSLKFRVNEFGLMEVVTDDFENTEPLTDVKESKSPPNLSGGPLPIPSNVIQESIPEPDAEPAHSLTPAAAAALKATEGDDTKIPPSLCQCENCGVYGMIKEFCGGGRFCSKTCVGQYAANRRASKKPAEGKLKKTKKRKLTNGDLDFDTKVIKLEDDGGDPQKLLTSKKTKGFSWTTYLEQTKAASAPSKLFRDAFPTNKNGFKVGMKMEGIDPRHPSLYCVLTVAEVRGYRLRLHFDGYSECYDFWTNADTPFIFPIGWVEKNGKKLQPPKGFEQEYFNWSDYLKLAKAQAAPKHLFTNSTATSVTPHGFRVGMKLEAVDKKNTVLTCVSTVGDVLGERILIHFDGWEDSYDYWCDPSSPYIHPVGWCQENGRPLSPPNDWPDIAGFTWEEYLQTTKSSPVPPRAFKNRPPHGFESGMALEAVDRRNPVLIRVATVKEVQPHSFLLHFDNWSEVYDYWVDDDCPDNHPCGWCAKTSHPLQPPPSLAADASGPGGCPTPGCTGIGHIKGAKYTGHYSAFGCPYSQLNMNKETALQDRMGPTRSDSLTDVYGTKLPKGMMDYSLSPEMKKCPTPNCDGSGHITGKYTAHHKVSGCPLAERNMLKFGRADSINGDVSPAPSPTKPLFGPGSGRGRKKHKLLKQYQQQQEIAAAEYEATGQLHHGIHQSVFMSSMVSPPVKDLPLCWDQHAKLLPSIHKHSMQEVSTWNVHQVADFISTLPGCKDLVRIFLEEQIDGEAFLLLSQADIVNIMSVKLGPALKIYNSILMFKAHCDV